MQRSEPADASPVALWRRPAKSYSTTPLVVLLHGRGADEHDLIALADRLPRTLVYVSPRGFVAAEGGYTWFESRGPGRPIDRSLRASTAILRAWLDGPAAHARANRTFVLGFSAGMILAGALVLADPQRYAGVVLLSGALALDGTSPATPGRLKGVPVFYASGTFDDAIPAALATRTATYLEVHSGAEVTRRTYRRGHSIAPREIEDIAAWLRERI